MVLWEGAEMKTSGSKYSESVRKTESAGSHRAISWFDSAGWVDSIGQDTSDECRSRRFEG